MKHFLTLLILCVATCNIYANTYTVTTASDNSGGTNPAANAGTGTLRQAIVDANAHAGADVISFNITGSGVQTITLLALLPAITGPTTINGYSQPGAAQGAIGSCTILIQINGNDQTTGGGRGATNNDGLFHFDGTASSSSISGLSIYNTGTDIDAIQIDPGNSNIQIWGNYIGMLANGTSPVSSADYDLGNGISIQNTSILSGAFTNIYIGTDGNGTNDANEGNIIDNAVGVTDGYAILIGYPSNTYSCTNIKISGNYIGLAADGLTPAPNSQSVNGPTIGSTGIYLYQVSNVLIGSNGDGVSDALEKNIISGNNGNGIDIETNTGAASGIRIAGNYIGTDKTGMIAVPNAKKATSSWGWVGVDISGTVTNFIFGFDDATMSAAVAPDVRNIVSGNSGEGLAIANVPSTPVFKICGNYFGVDATGNTALPNGQANPAISPSLPGDNIDIYGCTGVLIGTDADGDDDVLERNITCAAILGRGVLIRGGSSNTVVAGNYIGVGADGVTALGNKRAGVQIGNSVDVANNNRVGSNDDGTNDAAEANIIANNGSTGALNLRDGISVRNNSTGNRISRNIFYSNVALPIDLNDDGITLNDGTTTASNPNLLTDYPVITSWSIAGSTISVGGYVSTCSGNETIAGASIAGNKTIQFYKVADDGNQNGALTNGTCTRSVPHGEGMQYLGSISGVVNAFSSSFTLVSGATFSSGDKLTAIAIDASGNTSEFGVNTVTIQVNGTVFNDADGLTNGVVDGTGTNAGGLNAILYNNTTGVVAAVAAIAADGTYSISSTATSGNSFTVYITTNNPAIGSAAVPPVVLPVGWGNTGEYFGSGAGNDGTPNGVLSIGAVSGTVSNANFGIQQGFYDFGDVPLSYENNSSASSVPARNAPSNTLMIGSLPDDETAPASVTSGADNNGSNGDGSDEDGQSTPTTITIGSAYSRTITYTNTSGTTRTIYGWIDFNNNGIFEASEVASTLGTATAGSTNATTTLTWSTTQTRDALGANLYMRIRLAGATLTDNGATTVDERAIADGASTGTYGTATIGEVEDYRIPVTVAYDFGDVPISYEANSSSTSVPARHLTVNTIYMGSSVDNEGGPQNVTSGADNNTTNGDGSDEDGITSLPVINPGGSTTIKVNVFKTIAGTGSLYGWIDMDGDGKFSSGEAATVATTVSTAGATTLSLTWSSLPTSMQSKVYMRLQFTTASLADNAVTTIVDERAIADGASGGGYGISVNGEVEDYQLAVPVLVSGTVWDDANGNLLINGTEAGTNTGAQFVNLIDASGNVVNSVAISATGTYSIGVPANSSGYKLVIATIATATSPALTSGWVSTGESIGAGNTATQSGTLGQIEITTGSSAISAQNFGIDRTPAATIVTGTSQQNPGGIVKVTIPTLTGSDPEDGAYNGSSGTNTIKIQTLPSNGTLYYNGVVITAGQTITNYSPSLLTLDPNDGVSSVVFTYSEVDAAGQASSAVTVTMPFTTPVTFSCSSTIYQVQGSGPSTLLSYNPNTGTSSTIASISTRTNSLAYSTIDNLLWGWDQTNFKVIRIDKTGAFLSFTIANLPAVDYINGTILPGGYLVLYLHDATSYYVVDINPNHTSYLQLVDPSNGYAVQTGPIYGKSITAVNLHDFAYDPVSGFIYGIINPGSTNAFHIVSIDPSSNTTTIFPSSVSGGGITSETGSFGSVVTDATGNLYAYNDGSGAYYKVNIATGVATKISTGTTSSNSDAAGCPTVVLSVPASGTVFDDANGLNDNTVNGNGSNGGGLNAILYDNTTGAVAAVVAVAADGTYNFPGVTPGDNFTIYLTTNSATVGQAAIPLIALPSGWVSTGENLGSGAGNDGTVNSILLLGTVSATVTNANFGIDKRPTSAAATATSQPNPGGTAAAAVSSNVFNGTDAEDGTYSNNLSGRTVTLNPATGGTLYYNGIAVSSATVITNFDPAEVTLDPTAAGATSPTFTYSVNDNASVPSTAVTVTVPFTASSRLISGSVWDDTNANAVKDATEVFTNAGNLYANLVSSTGIVIQSVLVSSSGAYSLGGNTSTVYQIILTNGSQTIGNTLTTATLPSGWVNTGVNTGSANTANQTGIIGVASGITALSGQNFAVEQTPVANNVSTTATNPGSTGKVIAPTLTGTDGEDGTYTGVSNTNRVIINTLPSSGSLYYNGTVVTAGQTITNYNPTLLTFDPPDGAGSYSFTYSEVDAAGKSSTPATATININDLTISGIVYDDANGLTNGLIDGAAITTPSGSTLYANLVNHATGLVVGTTTVTNGTYSLGTASGIISNTNYDVVLSTTQGVAGTTIGATPALPLNWINTGEGATSTGDGTVNGLTNVNLTTASVTNENFGIEQAPEATVLSYRIIPVPTRGNTYPLDGSYRNMQPLSGNDLEDGTLGAGNTFVITSLGMMNGNILSYNGVQITGATTIPNYNPSKLTITFNQSGLSSFSFNYAVMDAAGVQSAGQGYSIWWGSAVLAVNLVDFTIEQQQNVAILKWDASLSSNDDHFMIEKSLDGGNWFSLGNVKVSNNLSLQQYHFTDSNLQNGDNFYRIRLVDKDSSVNYSGVKLLRVNLKWIAKIYPNPATNISFVEIKSTDALLSVTIAGMDGQPKLNRTISGNTVQGNTYKIDISHLASGVYFLQLVNTKHEIQYLKLVKM